jgi:hypothetical protein
MNIALARVCPLPSVICRLAALCLLTSAFCSLAIAQDQTISGNLTVTGNATISQLIASGTGINVQASGIEAGRFSVAAGSTNVTSGVGAPLVLQNRVGTPGNFAATLYYDANGNLQGSIGLMYGAHSGLGQGTFYIEPRIVATPSAFVVAPSGNVGIGTTSPTAKLDVNGNVNLGTPGQAVQWTQFGYGSYLDIDNSQHALRIRRANDLGVMFQAADGVSYFQYGNVGIGTTAPGEKLDVVGRIRSTDGLAYQTGNGVPWWVTGPANGPAMMLQAHSAAGGPSNRRGSLGWMDNNGVKSETLTWTDSGTVGIGTTTPAANLDVTGDIKASSTVTGSYLLANYLYGDAYPIQAIGPNVSKSANTYYGLLLGTGEGGTSRLEGSVRLQANANPALRGVSISAYENGYGPRDVFVPYGNFNIQAGNLTVAGSGTFSSNLTVGGNFSAASYVASAGNVTGGSSGLILSAGGTNQNVTLTPSGNGATALNGNVGIGTSSPGAALDIGGGSSFINSNPTYELFDANDKTVQIRSPHQSTISLLSDVDADGGKIGGLYFGRTLGQTDAWVNLIGIRAVQRGGTGAVVEGDLTVVANRKGELLRVMSDTGNLGVGTATPLAKLDIAGNIRVLGPDGYNATGKQARILFGDFSSETNARAGILAEYDYGLKFGVSKNGGAGDFGANSLTAMVIKQESGDVGIGTSAPLDILDVKTDTNRYFRVGTMPNRGNPVDFNVGGVYAGLSRPYDGAVVGGMFTYDTAAQDNNLGITSRSDIVFLGGAGAMGQSPERMRITGGGNVGIGTINPTALLTVANAPGNNPQLIVRDTAGSGSGGNGIGLYNDYAAAASRNWGLAQAVLAYGDFSIRQSTAQGGNPFSAGVDRLYINPSGNVGIGTTAPSYLLDVNGVIRSRIAAGSNLILSKPTGASLAFDNDAGIQTALIESGSPMNANRLEFWTNTSTNSGLIERMRIDNAGNVGINTVSPSAKLEVNGTTQIDGQFTALAGSQLNGQTNMQSAAIAGASSFGGTMTFTSAGNPAAGSMSWGTTATAALQLTAGTGRGLAFGVDGTAGKGLTITSGGVAAIGNSAYNSGYSADYQLQVGNPVGTANGGIMVIAGNGGASGGIAKLSFDHGTNADGLGRVWYDNSINEMLLGTNGVTRLVIDAAGNVGIGTTTPSAKLEVAGDTKVTSPTASTSSASGALVVTGGAGIGGNENVGGTLTVGTGATATTISTSGITTGGSVTAASYVSTTGSVAGSSSGNGLTLSAGAVNQNVTLVAAGAGNVVAQGNFVGQGTMTSQGRLTANSDLLVNGKVGVGVPSGGTPTTKMDVRGGGLMLSPAGIGSWYGWTGLFDATAPALWVQNQGTNVRSELSTAAATGMRAVYSGAVTGGTLTSPAPTPAGANLQLRFAAYDGTNFYNAATIELTADETHSASTHATSIRFGTYGNSEVMRVTSDGKVGIGTTNPANYKLAVAGPISAQGQLNVDGVVYAKEVVVDTTLPQPDYVFDANYRNMPLSEVEQHIKAEKHLPGVPSAQEVAAHGVNVGQMQTVLLQKIEELTLHMIEMEKENTKLRQRVEQLESAPK